MPNPTLIKETPLALADVKEALQKIEERDKELNYRSTKTKDYLNFFAPLSPEKKEELYKKLTNLNLVRLKENHIAKLLDFLPQTPEELKVILQAYPLSLSKKDFDSILEVIKEATK